MSVERAARHYDEVSEVWERWVMGPGLHFGVFTSGRDTLEEAAGRLTERLGERADLSEGLRVLDVGCGVGAPALYLAERYGCSVTGISTSAVGVERASAAAKARGLEGRARFSLRDAQDTGLERESFDRVFSLESAHLMPDKDRLFAELHRVLVPGGKLALCDVLLVGDEDVEIMQYAALGHSSEAGRHMREAVHATMHRAFGSSILAHTSVYEGAARRAGFVDLKLEDISAQTRRTLGRWADNACAHRAEIEAAVGPQYFEDLLIALLHMSFGWGRIGGYAILTGRKAQLSA